MLESDFLESLHVLAKKKKMLQVLLPISKVEIRDSRRVKVGLIKCLVWLWFDHFKKIQSNLQKSWVGSIHFWLWIYYLCDRSTKYIYGADKSEKHKL